MGAWTNIPSNNVPLVTYTRGNDLSQTMEGAGGIGGLLARSDGYSSSTGNWTDHNFYHADGNGNITYLVNSSQGLAAAYRYDPFGNMTYASGSLAGSNVYRFSSKEQHLNSGLYYYLYRFYDPSVQRWLNRDPLADLAPQVAAAKPASPAQTTEINLYRYVANAPIDHIDALGLWYDSITAYFCFCARMNVLGSTAYCGCISAPAMAGKECVDDCEKCAAILLRGTTGKGKIDPEGWCLCMCILGNRGKTHRIDCASACKIFAK
jgi:RHS repeat-associated protein